MNSSSSIAAAAAPAGRAPASPDPGWQRTLLAAVCGPVALGVILGLEVGPAAALLKAVALPGVLLAVAAVMVPALYIGATLAGVAPPALDMLSSLGRGFRACGLVMLGLAAPVVFLLATTSAPGVPVLLGACVTAAAVVTGLRVLFSDLFAGATLRAMAGFAAWSVVALGIGLRLYIEFVAV
ncbi:hypothetical protein [Haliangium sp.]|uniref:hypothetical protein n=1 Tax=Haliangium sp. TaxID=2663208 RepID=UPI003D0F4650